MVPDKEIVKWFKIIMTAINCLFAVPVVWALIRELAGPGPVNPGRVAATVGLVAIPLFGTLAITIAGSAVLEGK